VAVVANGVLAYAKGYGVANVETGQPMQADMLLRVGSIAKMTTGAMLAELAVRGQLELQAPISRYVPTLAGRRVGSVTTHQLMTHNAGWLDNAIAYGRRGESALGEVMREVSDSLFFTDPERTYSYSNPGISMAGYVGEAAAGRRYATLMDSLIMRPFGMARSTFNPMLAMTHPLALGHDLVPGSRARLVRPMTDNSAQWPAGFLFTSAPEMARFTIALMNAGQLEGRTVLSADAVRRVTTGYVLQPTGGLPDDSSYYGYGLSIGRRQGERSWTHGGSINGYSANVVMLPDRRAAVIVFANAGGVSFDALERQALALAAGVTLPAPPVRATSVPTAAQRAMLVGRYSQGGTAVEVAEVDGQLVLRQGPMTLPIQAEASRRFVTIQGTTRQLIQVQVEAGRAAFLHLGGRALARRDPPPSTGR
jgi:CubicO group peptidase (beta-lactamase class C family)